MSRAQYAMSVDHVAYNITLHHEGTLDLEVSTGPHRVFLRLPESVLRVLRDTLVAAGSGPQDTEASRILDVIKSMSAVPREHRNVPVMTTQQVLNLLNNLLVRRPS